MKALPVGCHYGTFNVDGVEIRLRQSEIEGRSLICAEVTSFWAGGQVPAYALILAAEAARALVQDVEPERLRPPARFVPGGAP